MNMFKNINKYYKNLYWKKNMRKIREYGFNEWEFELEATDKSPSTNLIRETCGASEPEEKTSNKVYAFILHIYLEK